MTLHTNTKYNNDMVGNGGCSKTDAAFVLPRLNIELQVEVKLTA